MVTLTGYDYLETPDFLKEHREEFGGPKAYNHYAVGWAYAMNTPYQWTKQVASHWGGTRNGAIVHWPARIKVSKEKGGGIRNQFHHVIDVAPTILEAAGLPQPLFVNGVQQRPIEGVSMLYSFDDANAAERHETQYFEMMGNRGIYHKGWTAVTKHRIPWLTGEQKMPAFDDDVWELYDTNVDWTQANDLTKSKDIRYVKKLHELQRLWLIEAVKYNVLPLDDRFAERSNPEIAGRPQLIKGRTQVLYGGMGRLSESSIVNFKNKSHTITAIVIVPDDNNANGVIIAQGGITGGWSLYAKEGYLMYCYNFYGVELTTIPGDGREDYRIPPGKHKVWMHFKYDGGGIGMGGLVTLYVGDTKVGEGKLPRTEPMMFSADETCDIGCEAGSPVTADYTTPGGKFSGEVIEVKLLSMTMLRILIISYHLKYACG